MGILFGFLVDLYRNVYLLGYQSCFKSIQMASIKSKSVKEDSHESK